MGRDSTISREVRSARDNVLIGWLVRDDLPDWSGGPRYFKLRVERREHRVLSGKDPIAPGYELEVAHYALDFTWNQLRPSTNESIMVLTVSPGDEGLLRHLEGFVPNTVLPSRPPRLPERERHSGLFDTAPKKDHDSWF